jgi:hypothetical protein
VNAVDAEGMTPLILSAINGNMRSVRLLLFAGADKFVEDQKKKTAL